MSDLPEGFEALENGKWHIPKSHASAFDNLGFQSESIGRQQRRLVDMEAENVRESNAYWTLITTALGLERGINLRYDRPN